MARRSRLLWLAFLAVILESGASGRASVEECSPPPNSKFKDRGVAAGNPSGSDMQHSRSSMIAFIEQNFGEGAAELAAEIDAATHPVTGCARVVEVYNAAGKMDATTIGVMTRGKPLWFSSLVLIHEYRHWLRAWSAAQDSGDPEETDPETAEDNPCGECNHAQMGADDMDTLGFFCDEQTSASVRAEMCAFAEFARQEIGKALSRCRYDGCPGCCGFGYVPNAGEVWQAPACCN